MNSFTLFVLRALLKCVSSVLDVMLDDKGGDSNET